MGRIPGVTVINLNASYAINITFVKYIVKKILGYLRMSGRGELEFIFLDDKAIGALNRKYKRKNRPTDVLCFGIDKEEFGGGPFLGEIFISLDTALKNSKTFGTDFENEIVLYVIHAILHLTGYDDGDKKDALRMSGKQERVLRYLCKTEDLSKVLMRR